MTWERDVAAAKAEIERLRGIPAAQRDPDAVQRAVGRIRELATQTRSQAPKLARGGYVGAGRDLSSHRGDEDRCAICARAPGKVSDPDGRLVCPPCLKKDARRRREERYARR